MIRIPSELYEYDSDTRQFIDYSSQDAVSPRWLSGTCDANGDAVESLTGSPDDLARADEIGWVQGHPEDPDFVLAQFRYRSEYLENPTKREVDTRYAEDLRKVLDNTVRDPARAEQLAEDLSGLYGPYRVWLEPVGNLQEPSQLCRRNL